MKNSKPKTENLEPPKAIGGLTLDMKTITQSDFCRAALKMPDRASADQLISEWARKHELDVNYVRWFVINWTQKWQQDQLATAKTLYNPEPTSTKAEN